MWILEILKVIILGIVEGITEWLPISSTGHLYLLDGILNLNVSKEFKDLFMYVIQLGAIMAVVLIFWPKIWPFHRKKNAAIGSYWHGRSRSKIGASLQQFVDDHVDLDKIKLWLKILVSCLPALLIIPFNDAIDNKLMAPNVAPFVIASALVFYGILFIIVENYNKKHRRVKIRRLEDITWTTALLIGVFQMLAAIPGTSRSGATIIGGIILGMSRKVAAEYTFFLAIPVMFGVSLIKVIKFGIAFSAIEVVYLILGMIVAFIVSVFAIKFLMGYVRKHDFKIFGWYRIALGILVLAVTFLIL